MKFRNLPLSLAAAMTLSVTGTVQAQDPDQELATVAVAPNIESPGSLESSKSSGGQCYARVSIPAVYRTESIKTEIRPKLDRFKITPPVFKDTTEIVTVSPAVTQLTAIQPVLETKTETFEIMAGSTGWVRGSADNSNPLTAGELEELKGAGIDIASVKSGTCFYEHFSEATIEDITTKITISDATETLSVTDAVMKDELVTVTTVPAHSRMIEVPPSFKKGTENVMVQPATKAWKTECGAVEQVDHMTGETLCLVDVAAEFETLETDVIDIPALVTNVDERAEYKEVKTQVLVSEAKEVREAIPAKYDFIDRQRIAKPASYSWLALNAKPAFGAEATGRAACFVTTPAVTAEYEREVVKTAGRFETTIVPAKTETINVKQLVAKALSSQTTEAPKFKTVQQKILVEDAKIEWKPVLCQVEFSEDIIVQLQKALQQKGYEPGPIDGVMGRGTSRALQEYQKANKMADGGVTIEALEKLGVNL